MGLILRKPDALANIRDAAAIAEQAALAVAGRGRAPLETWHNIGATGEPGFNTGYANFGGGYNPLAFFRDPAGFVHLRGLINGASLGAMGTIFTLPSGYWPANIERQVALGQVTTGGISQLVLSQVEIWVTGEVRGGVGVSDWLSLDNHHFRNQ